MEKLIGITLAICVVVVILGACSALGGFIFMLLFNFVAPLFWKAAPVLSFTQAWASWFLLLCFAGLFKNHYRKN